jgi:hypothetical protein
MGENKVLTYVMTLSVAVGIPVVAHFLGRMVRQWPAGSKRLRHGITVVAVLALTVGALAGINMIRRAYLQAHDFPLDATTEQAFILINLFVLLAAATLSYSASDPDEELEGHKLRTERLRRKLERCDREIERYTGEVEALRRRRDAAIEGINSIIRELIHIYRHENIRFRSGHARPRAFETEPQRILPELPSGDQPPVDQSELATVRAEWHNA